MKRGRYERLWRLNVLSLEKQLVDQSFIAQRKRTCRKSFEKLSKVFGKHIKYHSKSNFVRVKQKTLQQKLQKC